MNQYDNNADNNVTVFCAMCGRLGAVGDMIVHGPSTTNHGVCGTARALFRAHQGSKQQIAALSWGCLTRINGQAWTVLVVTCR